jgi:glycerol-3-phosphate cytidylyltransferase
MTTIITYGTFDLFHVGHVRLLKRLKDMGSRLIVGCSTDEFNALKGKQSIYTYQNRYEILASCKYVDVVIPENNWEQKKIDIHNYGVDIFAMGDDWSGKFDELQDLCKVIYLPRTVEISTTEIKNLIKMTVNSDIKSISRRLALLSSELDNYIF